VDDDARADLDHEHRQDDVVDDLEQTAVGRHCGLAGFEPKHHRVDDDQNHDDALGARIKDNGAKPGSHVGLLCKVGARARRDPI